MVTSLSFWLRLLPFHFGYVAKIEKLTLSSISCQYSLLKFSEELNELETWNYDHKKKKKKKKKKILK